MAEVAWVIYGDFSCMWNYPNRHLVQFNKELDAVAFVCSECGRHKEGRCKPRKCPECGGQNTFEKKE